MDTFVPLTPEHFDDLEALFHSDAVTRGCFCMWWRQSAREWKQSSAGERRERFREVVGEGPPGLLAYRDGRPLAWVQVTPRRAVPRFNGPRAASRPAPDAADLDSVWALSCFFIHREGRGGGLMTPLAAAACNFAAERGATAVEAAPVAPKGRLIWGDGYIGIVSALERAGFRRVEQRTERRWLMRWTPP